MPSSSTMTPNEEPSPATTFESPAFTTAIILSEYMYEIRILGWSAKASKTNIRVNAVMQNAYVEACGKLRLENELITRASTALY